MPVPHQAPVVKTGRYTEGIKLRISYVYDTSKSLIYYTKRDGEDKLNVPMSHNTKGPIKNPQPNKELLKLSHYFT